MQDVLDRLNALATNEKLGRVQRSIAASHANGLLSWKRSVDTAEDWRRDGAQRDLDGAIETARMIADELTKSAA